MYCELHARSAFSFLEGAATPEELITVCQERGIAAMALTAILVMLWMAVRSPRLIAAILPDSGERYISLTWFAPESARLDGAAGRNGRAG